MQGALEMKVDNMVSMSSPQVREATIDEAESIAAVLRSAFAEYELAYTLEAFVATTPTADRLRARWDEGPVWAALLDGSIVGTVAAVVKEGSLYMRSMAVAPAARPAHWTYPSSSSGSLCFKAALPPRVSQHDPVFGSGD